MWPAALTRYVIGNSTGSARLRCGFGGSAQFEEQAPPQQPGPQPPPPRLTGAEPSSDPVEPNAAKLDTSTLVSVDSQLGQTCLRSRLAKEVRTSNFVVQSVQEYS